MKLKKFMASAMALTMTMAMVVPAFAADVTVPTNETVTGTGSISGYVDTDLFVVNVPTTPSVTFTLDPQGLLVVKNQSGIILDGADSAPVTNASAYKDKILFNVSGDSTGTKYTTAAKLEVINKGTVKVDVDVSAKVVGLTGTDTDHPYSISLVDTVSSEAKNEIAVSVSSQTGTISTAASSTFEPAEDDSSQEIPAVVTKVQTAGSKHTTIELAAVSKDDYKLGHDGANYTYTLNTATDKDLPMAVYTIEGTVNTKADWKAFYDAQDNSVAALGMEVTYSIKEHVDGPTATMTADGKITITNLTSEKLFKSATCLVAGNAKAYSLSVDVTPDLSGYNATTGGTYIIQMGSGWLRDGSGKLNTITITLSDETTIECSATLN